MKNCYGAIEAGGTKFVCGVGSGPENLIVEQFETTTPEETIIKAILFLKEQDSKNRLKAIGIGSFGPLDLDKNSRTFGHITFTPKPNWAHTDFVGMIKNEFDLPVVFDTDVNAAALGEHYWGAAKDLSNFIYLTIGTGIGGGGMINGKHLHGMVHPEMGHIFIPVHSQDSYKGKCPFHTNHCFEGLASGPAIQDRWGKPAKDLDKNHKAWDLEAYYISLALINYICTLSPERIILGGGVMQQTHLFPLIHKNVRQWLNNYIQSPEIMNTIHTYIVPPSLGNRAGILGAIALAIQDSKQKF